MMTWEQKLAALKAITSTHLEMRKPGDWYVSAYAREVSDGKGILSGIYGTGKSPEAAVNDDFDRLALVQFPRYIVVRHRSDDEKKVRWNGFMWEAVRDN